MADDNKDSGAAAPTIGLVGAVVIWVGGNKSDRLLPRVVGKGKRMSSVAELLVKAALVGIGGTIVLDLWALFMARVMGLSATNWAMVGRWFGNIPRGRFVQETMTKAEPVKGELAIGWIAHYAVGIGYGLLLPAFWGQDWIDRPTLLPPMILAWVLLLS